MSGITREILEEVKQEYLRQIEIPQNKPSTQYILCPIGLVGAGKTTVVKPLAKKLELVRVSGDEIRKIFKEKEVDYDSVKELVFQIISKFLKEGFSIAIDSDCVTEDSQEKIKEAEEKLGVKIVWIHINPPEEFILHKLSNLKPNWLGTAEEMVENYYQRKPLHRNLDLPFTYTFDTSGDDLDEQILEAATVIRELTGSNADQ